MTEWCGRSEQFGSCRLKRHIAASSRLRCLARIFWDVIADCHLPALLLVLPPARHVTSRHVTSRHVTVVHSRLLYAWSRKVSYWLVFVSSVRTYARVLEPLCHF